ncbi:DNA-directed RNA polymerase III subunit RPC7-like isoform X1 [Oratosquilla oratoria]|uniref:DNA-directed RNA polymerase III subunit RPC7-like isoform X1 n=1 Tax=Oratosquilla oratoria TaxID=337810 RepID=UPI003F77109A
MSARGRGGGRGRGRGMTYEQLGVQKGEALPERVVGPPETFPPLEFRPVQPSQEKSLTEAYLSVVKKDFKEHMLNSQYFIQPDVKRSDIERYSDRYQMFTNKTGGLNLNWSRFPKELRPVSVGVKRKKAGKTVKPNVKKVRWAKEVKDVSQTLEELEKKEATVGSDEEGEEEGETKTTNEEEIEEIEGEVDEEMDEGTDYANSYFDNGESYIDEEDDALDDGGVY